MPIIAKSTFQPMQSGGGGQQQGGFSDPTSIWRNSVNVRHVNEFALVEFITDLEFGDISHFHPIPATSQNGKAFTQYVYCTNKNATQEEGKVIDEPCPHCDSADNTVARTRDRYRYWVLHYGTYHSENNPDVEAQREWTQSWKQVQVGRQNYYRETILKPQIIELAPTTWESIQQHAERNGTIKNVLFEYGKNMSEGRVNYRLIKADIQVPDISSQLDDNMIKDLPSLQDIAAGLVNSVDVPQLSTGSSNSPQQKVEDANAFENMANITDGEEF